MEKLRIAVTGLAVTYPFGGMFWDYMQYVLGLHQLGHDVLYVEDTGKWCYDPEARTYSENPAKIVDSFARDVAKLDQDLSDKWYYRDSADKGYGKSWCDVVSFMRTADLFLHVSASCLMRDEYFLPRTLVFIDSDPMCTPVTVPGYRPRSPHEEWSLQCIQKHDVHFTFGENVGKKDCGLSTEYFDWIPTRQPVVLSCFEPYAKSLGKRRNTLTTVGSWEHTRRKKGDNGLLASAKSVEFERFMSLPSRSPLELELALSGEPPIDRLQSAGWTVIDAFEVSKDPWNYRQYLSNSLAEWSVSKHAYVSGNTGWFSCRTACYLALGVPAIVQETGFSRFLPTGEGLFAFQDQADVVHALRQIQADPERHSRAASRIAREFFDSDIVLSALVEKAMAVESVR